MHCVRTPLSADATVVLGLHLCWMLSLHLTGMSDSSSSDKEAYKYVESGVEYSDDTSNGEFTQDVNNKDSPTQNIRGNPQGKLCFKEVLHLGHLSGCQALVHLAPPAQLPSLDAFAIQTPEGSSSFILMSVHGIYGVVATNCYGTATLIESEEMNKEKVKELEDTVVQLEEKGAKSIETKIVQQLNACLSQIEHKYPDIDLLWVYEINTGDTSVGDIGIPTLTYIITSVPYAKENGVSPFDVFTSSYMPRAFETARYRIRSSPIRALKRKGGELSALKNGRHLSIALETNLLSVATLPVSFRSYEIHLEPPLSNEILPKLGRNWVSPSFKGGSTEILMEILVGFSQDRTHPKYGLVSLSVLMKKSQDSKGTLDASGLWKGALDTTLGKVSKLHLAFNFTRGIQRGKKNGVSQTNKEKKKRRFLDGLRNAIATSVSRVMHPTFQSLRDVALEVEQQLWMRGSKRRSFERTFSGLVRGLMDVFIMDSLGISERIVLFLFTAAQEPLSLVLVEGKVLRLGQEVHLQVEHSLHLFVGVVVHEDNLRVKE
ncbi:hypothetical protein FNV43_RR21280 [Rhamnella rubrinervis]|uniref:Uncharacterized protein n=1 Tax=Rhamnella rubrinervis TaxID=2594499 RepID=A0A8K0E0G0_9ROSA|nr:hypothetical protein FNV43_RR21280 [Rhamnella rubrinervis]